MNKLRRPHETKSVGGVRKLVRENFTARFVRRGEAPLTVQCGGVFDDGGNEIPLDQVPDWLWEDYALQTAEQKEKLQLVKPAGKKA